MYNGHSFTAAISGRTIKRPGGNELKSWMGLKASRKDVEEPGGGKKVRADTPGRLAPSHFGFCLFCQVHREESIWERVEYGGGLKGLGGRLY